MNTSHYFSLSAALLITLFSGVTAMEQPNAQQNNPNNNAGSTARALISFEQKCKNATEIGDFTVAPNEIIAALLTINLNDPKITIGKELLRAIQIDEKVKTILNFSQACKRALNIVRGSVVQNRIDDYFKTKLNLKMNHLINRAVLFDLYMPIDTALPGINGLHALIAGIDPYDGDFKSLCDLLKRDVPLIKKNNPALLTQQVDTNAFHPQKNQPALTPLETLFHTLKENSVYFNRYNIPVDAESIKEITILLLNNGAKSSLYALQIACELDNFSEIVKLLAQTMDCKKIELAQQNSTLTPLVNSTLIRYHNCTTCNF